MEGITERRVDLNEYTVSQIPTQEKEVASSSNCLQWVALAITIAAVALIAIAVIALFTGVSSPFVVILLPVGAGLGIINAVFYGSIRFGWSKPVLSTLYSIGVPRVSFLPYYPPQPSRGPTYGHSRGNNAPQYASLESKSGWGNSTPVPVRHYMYAPEQNHNKNNRTPPPSTNPPPVKTPWNNQNAQTPVYIPPSAPVSRTPPPNTVPYGSPMNSPYGNPAPVYYPPPTLQTPPYSGSPVVGGPIRGPGNAPAPQQPSHPHANNSNNNKDYSRHSAWGKDT